MENIYSTKDNVDVIIRKLVLSFFKGQQLHLEDTEIKQLSLNQQDRLLNQTIYTTHFKKYPCNQNFCRIFFKNLIHQLERHHEVHDGMYEYLCSVMKNRSSSFSYQHYFIKNNMNIITIKQTRNMVLNGTTGLKTWEAALMLADWALDNEDIFMQKKVLELGSGVGFTGITLAKHCDIESIIMTDHHPEVLRVINDNILINFQLSNKDLEPSNIYEINQRTIGTMMLDWNNTADLPQHLKPDIIIGADIVFDPSILKPLINVLYFFYQRNNNVEIFIASVIRNLETFNAFIELLESSNFDYEKMDITKKGNIDWDDDTQRCLLKIYRK